jgi:hypothetical protein
MEAEKIMLPVPSIRMRGVLLSLPHLAIRYHAAAFSAVQGQLYLPPLTCAKGATVGGRENDELGQLERLIARLFVDVGFV